MEKVFLPQFRHISILQLQYLFSPLFWRSKPTCKNMHSVKEPKTWLHLAPSFLPTKSNPPPPCGYLHLHRLLMWTYQLFRQQQLDLWINTQTQLNHALNLNAKGVGIIKAKSECQHCLNIKVKFFITSCTKGE
jgi:hypothetical protein